MPLRSIFIPAPAFQDGVIQITGDENHHLIVARVAPGEMLEVFDGNGNVWTIRVEAPDRRRTIARLMDARHVDRGAIELILGLAMIRAAAFELALEKVVEAGVTRIVPFAAARSSVPAAGRRQRWQRILVEAAKQSKRFYLPRLDTPVSFDRVLAIPASSKIMFAPAGESSLKSALAGSPVLYLIGPEGGWTDDEVATARERGFRTVSLGSGILKAETAAIAGASLICYELGR
jgi:16S rRNA (uracil1498-N3)-methyltransferase